MIEITINETNYIRAFTEVNWSGGINGTSRILKAKTPMTEKAKAEVGDNIQFAFEGSATLFTGKIFKIEKNASNEMIEIIAYDNSIYLNKNKFVKNYFNRTPSEIVKEICSELELEVGNLPQDIVKCTFPAINKSGYEIILIAYTIQHNKDKKIYSVVSREGKIEVVEQGTALDINLDGQKDLTNTKYSQSIEDMINQVVVYKTDKGKTQIIDKVENADDKKKYGIFQNVIEYNKDMNNIFNAREMLKGLESKADIEAIGDVDVISGYNIGITENKTSLVGNFLVSEDTHIFTNGEHKMTLELNFENVMDKIDWDKKDKQKSKKKKGKKKSAFDNIERVTVYE